MDLGTITDLSDDDLREVFAAVDQEMRRRNLASNLTPEEKSLARQPNIPGVPSGYIKAIAAYRSRTNCGLLEAKRTVDAYKTGVTN